MRVVFLGSTILGEHVLNALLDAKVNIVLAITEPSKVGNRGKMTLPLVFDVCQKRGVKCLQFEKVCRDGLDDIIAAEPDLIVTAAFGQILTSKFLEIAPTINVHPSLLPKYRGATPIQAAILNGDNMTGVTVLQTVKALDAGDILMQKSLEILDGESAGELFERASVLAGQCAVEAVKLIESGKAIFAKQDDEKATFCKTIKKEEGLIDFSKNANEIVNFVRAYNPWPCAFCLYNGKMLKVFKASKVENTHNLKNGQIFASKELFVGCCDGQEEIKFEIIQMEGSKKMDAKSFLNGKKLEGFFDGK